MTILLLLVLLLAICFYLYKQKQAKNGGDAPKSGNVSTRTAVSGVTQPSQAASKAQEIKAKNTPSEDLRQQVADLPASTPSAPGPLLGDSPDSTGTG
ncbi:hypothetical protein Y032_0401g778 [Ancylostoma ceylanicum]|uniref:Uncharacterized protein n=1 Tax=Ancylostoma ceylanicum TaxID=53326 RepID=A0A016X4Z3_9BILA|nr:hypothetical protein Y032_0401g778 [Ancylostoma ceylanicum]